MLTNLCNEYYYYNITSDSFQMGWAILRFTKNLGIGSPRTVIFKKIKGIKVRGKTEENEKRLE